MLNGMPVYTTKSYMFHNILCQTAQFQVTHATYSSLFTRQKLGSLSPLGRLQLESLPIHLGNTYEWFALRMACDSEVSDAMDTWMRCTSSLNSMIGRDIGHFLSFFLGFRRPNPHQTRSSFFLNSKNKTRLENSSWESGFHYFRTCSKQ